MSMPVFRHQAVRWAAWAGLLLAVMAVMAACSATAVDSGSRVSIGLAADYRVGEQSIGLWTAEGTEIVEIRYTTAGDENSCKGTGFVSDEALVSDGEIVVYPDDVGRYYCLMVSYTFDDGREGFEFVGHRLQADDLDLGILTVDEPTIDSRIVALVKDFDDDDNYSLGLRFDGNVVYDVVGIRHARLAAAADCRPGPMFNQASVPSQSQVATSLDDVGWFHCFRIDYDGGFEFFARQIDRSDFPYPAEGEPA